MKRIGSALAALVLLCCLTVNAAADVIWEPRGDSFYDAHADECAYEGRSYYANSPEGHCGIYSEPDGSFLADVKNGAELYVSFTFDAFGTLWGVVEYDAASNPSDYLSCAAGHESGTGWVDMSELLARYDAQSFEAEYAAEFTPYDGGFADLCASEGRRVIVWTYPGSGEMNADFDTLHQNYSPLKPSDTWTDGGGRVWGKISYYMGARGWVCLSDPGNDALPVTDHDYNLYPAARNEAGTGDSSAETAVPAATGDPMGGLIVGVAAVCGITGLLLLSLRRRGDA